MNQQKDDAIIEVSECHVCYYTVEEAAAVTHLSTRTIWRKIKARKIIAKRIFGSVRIPCSEIDKNTTDYT